MIQARFQLNEYTTRVLDVVKGKFGLKNRSEALNKMALEFGNEFVEQTPNEDVLRELDAISQKHKKKYGMKAMKDSELKELLDI